MGKSEELRRSRGLEIILRDELQAALDHFSAAFEVRIGVFEAFGRELACGLGQGPRPFCRFIREELGLEWRCRDCDMLHLAEAARSSAPHVYRCHAGLAEAICPLRLDGGSPAGFFMIGQFRVEGEGLPARLSKELARRPDALAKAKRLFEELPAMPARRLPHAVGLFAMLVSMAAERRMLSMKGELAVCKVEDALLSDLSKGLSLKEAARLLGRSPSSVSHLFKERLGVSFKQRLLALRLDAAKALLKGGCPVAEAARRCGFSSAFHFSRLFKKRVGVPPSSLKP